jgi:glycosyltransferase involved in cell wall biosynthesis
VKTLKTHKKIVAIMCFSSSSGGMELDAIKLARLLSKEMEVVLLCKEGEFIHHSHQGVNRDYSLEPVAFSSRTFSLSMLLRVRSLIKQYSFDNVIFFGASELKTLYFAFLGFKINLLVRHGTTKSKAKKDWFHRLIYSRVNYHIALSKHLLNNAKYIVPVTGNVSYKIIHPSYEITTVKESLVEPGKKDKLFITHVGRVAPGKGQVDAVRACKQLYNNGINFQFDILGGLDSNEYVESLKAEIGSSDFSSRIRLRGHVTNVSEYLQATDIFLFPSSGEGMANAFIEAMHFSAVCIVYDNTVFPEFIEMGFYLHLVKDGDVDALSQALLDVALDVENEKQRSKVNIGLTKEYFQVEREMSDWREVLV